MKRVAYIITAVAVLSVGINAFAAHTDKITVKDSYVQVEVSGNISSGAENAAVSFYISDADKELAHADQKNSGAGGGYHFTARINPELGGGKFDYRIAASGAAEESGSIDIVDMAKTLAIVDAINNKDVTVSRIEAAFEGYDPCLNMPVYGKIDKAAIYSGLLDAKSEINGACRLFEKLKELTVLEGLKQGSQAMTQNGSLLYLDIIGAEQTVIDNYNDKLNDKGRENVNKYMLEAKKSSLPDYAAELKKLVYTNMLTNGKTVDYDEAEQIIQSYGDSIGINVSEYNKLGEKGEVKKAILNSGAANPEALKKAYEAAIEDLEEDKEEKKGGGGGGGSAVSGYAPSSAGTVPQQSTAEAKSGFSDMSGYAWAEPAVAGLKAKNIMSGKSADSFAPQDNITREEFVKAIMSAFSLMPESNVSSAENKFSDVAAEAWYAPYVTEAERLGIISGIDDTFFGVGYEITRQDMVVVAFRALRYTKAAIDTSAADTEAFTDRDMIADYAADGVGIFHKMGLVNGYPDGSFRPFGTATRAEAAQLIWSLVNLNGI